jgi:hypothetical protein
MKSLGVKEYNVYNLFADGWGGNVCVLYINAYNIHIYIKNIKANMA